MLSSMTVAKAIANAAGAPQLSDRMKGAKVQTRNELERFLSVVLLAANVAGLTLALGTSVQAEEGMIAQQNACRPDVFRLCRDFIPDRVAIRNCLEGNRPNLSPACRAVFSPWPKREL
ncbi:hypothetical protein [Bradyrhizobium genosp. A]|uniref:hypothetical protein n=1 Tax=Bradyrhizobium genosp. A TaxID=83626 RepID=UPI003CE76AD4